MNKIFIFSQEISHGGNECQLDSLDHILKIIKSMLMQEQFWVP